jgi:anti-sigma regulatory factor (Ser/Thr protein kinase)
MQNAPVSGFRHEAVLYEGERGFVDRIAPFVREGIDAGQPTLVVVGRSHLDALRDAIGEAAPGLVEYRDMEMVGANPARIIPAWDEFAAEQIGRGAGALRGVGEPIWSGRTAPEIEECHWHEALVNQAFANVEGFWLVCPYDVAGLAPSVVAEAQRTHPLVSGSAHDTQAASPISTASPRSAPFAPAEHLLAALVFGVTDLPTLRGLVAEEGARAGLSAIAVDDLVLAVSEVATNSLLYGGGTGVMRMWLDAGDVVCEVQDSGVITDSLADRRRPGPDPQHARGLWTANRLCDLVQIRSSPERGTTVRLRMHTRGRAT